MTMKNILNIMFAAVALCLTAACQKEEVKDSVNPAFVAEWHLSTVEVDGAVQNYPFDVYLISIYKKLVKLTTALHCKKSQS